jgi:RHS repeat-associated protein
LGQILKTTYSYTQPGTQQTFYNQLTSQKQYDYDGTTLLKEARNAYENNSAYTGRHIFSLVKTAEIYDGAGNRVSKTDYEYDDNAIVNGTGSPNLKATSGVTMHSVSYDQYTTETQQGPNCLEWAYGDPYDPYGSQYCVQWDTISAYDPNSIFRGNLTKTTVYSDAATPSGAIAQTKQYDVTGNLVAESASCCELKTYDYTLDTQFAYPTTQTRGSSDSNSTIRNTSTSVYDFNTGLIKQSTDPNGRTSSTTYDADTLRPTVSTSSTGAYTQTTYDEAAMTITDEVKDSSGVRAGKTKRYLNGLGLVKQEDSFGPSDVVDSVQTKYNQLAEVWKTSRPYRTCDTPQFSEKFYDVLGRVTKIVGPDGSETKAFYNETSRPDSASTLVGNTIRVMDAWGRERWGRFNAQQRLAEVVEPNPSGNGSVSATGSMVTNYTYDTMDRLTQTSQGSQLRKFKYDSLGRITRQKLAEQAATLDDSGAYVGSGSGTWSSAAVYDNRSNLTQRTDARGVRVNYSFQISGADDSLNRIQSISYDLTGTHDTTNPIPAAPTVSYEYMTTGDLDRVKKVTSSGISTDELTYDVEGRVTDQTKTILSRTSYPMATSFTYDTLSRVTQVLDPVQYGQTGSPRRLIQNSYDAASRLTGLVVNGQRQAGDIIYNAADQTTSINIGTSGTNQINEQYTFDSQTGLLTNQKAIKNGTATLLDLSYDYNRNNSNGTLSGKTGHLTRVLDNLNHDKDREYQFDALGRLTMAKGKASNQWTQTYVYDRYGNRTSVTATGTAADNSTMPADGIPNLAFNSANNRITTSGFQYDLAGNQIRALAEDGTTWLNFEYDAANRLVNIKQDNGTLIQNQLFGVGNERLALIDSSSNQTTYYDGSVEYVEYSGNGVLVWSKSTVYLGDSELSTITPDGSGGEYTEFEHPDRLGTRLKTNQSGGTSYEQAHLPFGKALNAESSMTTSNKRFTSYDRSAATGLDYAQNRTYDSKQGRFTQVDPSGMGSVSLAAPQTLNLYAYCANDPINHVDPSGLGFFSFLKSLFSWVGKILKWIAIAVAIAVVVVAIVLSPQTALLLVKAIVGFIGQIMGITVTNAPVLIMDFSGEIIGASVSTSISIGISSYVVAGFFAVGAVSSFAQTRDRPKNKETSEQRRKRVILRSINSALWRLRHMKGCKEFIQGSSSQDPVAVLKGLKKEKNIFYDPSLGLGKNDPVAQTVDLTGEPNFGQGVNSHIHLGRKFFTSTVGDWVGTMNVQNTRTNTVLHELKHAVDNQHLPGEADDYYYNEIAKKCFGVTP